MLYKLINAIITIIDILLVKVGVLRDDLSGVLSDDEATREFFRHDGTKIIIFKGTIKKIDLEGGFWGILGDDGLKYYPVNLDQYANFLEDGKRVVVDSLILSNMVSITQWGTTVSVRDLIEIPYGKKV